ncbi:DUF3795 domain-containing protein [Candidatus Bathyarchaeota archaeon]|nr:DUF3795 domain-containing protein [Candidatus Bathyarchaeota archaeon]
MGQPEDKNNEKSEQVSYCGLFCPDCPLYAGKVSDIAKDLRKELRRVQYDKFAKYISKFPAGKELEQFNEFYAILGILMKFRCERGCRLGGGSENCQIRQCNQDQNFQGCWQCSKYKNCTKLDSLNSLHGNAHRKNLENIQKKGISEFTKENKPWYN